MKKWINTFLYGDKKTIFFIISVFCGTVATISFAVAAVMKLSLLYGAISVLAGVITGILLQNYTLQDKVDNFDSNEEKEKVTEALTLLSEPVIEETKKKEIEFRKPADQRKSEETIYDNYGEKELEQLFCKYKVKQEYRKIMIDSCACFRIRQCPAYIWKNKKCLSILLIEEKPRFLSIPLKEIKDIYYERGVLVKNKDDYEEMKKPSYIASLFSPYLPNYYEKIHEEQKRKYKNLYVIGPKLKVTNTSARNLFDILELEFSVEDKIMESTRISPYFKLAYKSNILLQDRVIDLEEYRQRIRMIVTAIAEDEEEDEFHRLIEQFVEAKLITAEYGDYYKEKRKEYHITAEETIKNQTIRDEKIR